MFSYMCISIFSLNRFPNRFPFFSFLPTAGARAGTSHAGPARMPEDCGAVLSARAAGRTETRVEAWRTPGRSPEGGGGGIVFSLGSRLPHPIPDSTPMGQTGGGEPQRLLCRIRLLWGRPAGVVRGPPSAGQIAPRAVPTRRARRSSQIDGGNPLGEVRRPPPRGLVDCIRRRQVALAGIRLRLRLHALASGCTSSALSFALALNGLPHPSPLVGVRDAPPRSVARIRLPSLVHRPVAALASQRASIVALAPNRTASLACTLSQHRSCSDRLHHPPVCP
jgi:hypothetical protein